VRTLVGFLLLLSGCGSGSNGGGDGPPADLARSDSASADLAAEARDLAVPPSDIAMPPADLTPPPDLAAPADLATNARDFSGVMCPMPPSVAMFDATKLTCQDLIDQYALAIVAAEACGCDKDCSVALCETVCCNCQKYVNPGDDNYPKAQAIMAEWKVRLGNGGCMMPICPKFACPPPLNAGCKAMNGAAAACQTI
jgi:hypothetical protein